MKRGSSSATDIQQLRILKGALNCFADTGYVGTTISVIAKQGGISHGLVHHYFDSKENLFTTIINSGLVYLKQTSQMAVKRGTTAEDKLRIWIYSILHSLDPADINLYRRLVMQVLGAPGLHPLSCTNALDNYTKEEVSQLADMLSELGQPVEKAFQSSCILFNVLLGCLLVGTHPDHLATLYRYSCEMIGISPDPISGHVEFPPIPWSFVENPVVTSN